MVRYSFCLTAIAALTLYNRTSREVEQAMMVRAQRAALQLPPRRAAKTASKKQRSRAPKAVSCKRRLGGRSKRGWFRMV